MKTAQIQAKVSAAKETAEYFLMYQAGILTYDQFMLQAIKIAVKNDEQQLDAYIEWLESERNSSFSNCSSNSTLNAIIDFDNLFSENMTEEQLEIAESIWENEIGNNENFKIARL